MNPDIEIDNEKAMISYCTIPLLNKKQLDNQLEKQVQFLKTIYPFLENDQIWNEGCIELRAIKRDSNIDDYLRSYNTWHMQEKDIATLKKFLGMLNGKGYCLYYSIFAFDYKKEVYKNGKTYKRGKVNNENALFTTVLVMDYDNITLADFKGEKQKLLDLGIETLDVFTGHGYQSIILLDNKVTDKGILKKFTNTMLSKGFKIDASLVDPARVCRQPFSFNCKSLDKKNRYYNESATEIFATAVVTWTTKRYNIANVFVKINSMKDVIPQIPLLDNNNTVKTTITKTRPKDEIVNITKSNKANINNIYKVYPMLNFERLPKPIQLMLKGTRDGYRNKVILFLIPFLRNSLGLDLQTIKQVMILWGEKCTPIIDKQFIETEITRIYSYNFSGKHGTYTEDLATEYGHLDFTKHTKSNKIIIPNAFFDDFYKIKDGSVKIYLSIKLENSIYKTEHFNQKNIESLANISRSAFFRNIIDLIDKGYISKKRANRRNKEEYIYYINPYFSATAGFTKIDNRVVRLMINEMTDGEIKFYSYLSLMVGDTKNDCWASQKYLSEKIGKTQQGISLITKNLMNKGYIKKTTEEKDGIKHCTYNLIV